MLVECVPNFSEGRDPAVIERLQRAASSVAGVHLLDTHVDADHNRCVLTLVGEGSAVSEAVFRAVREAVASIDLRTHEGVHPRLGAADVVPFVPLGSASLAECADLARGLGARLAEELALPVYHYGAAATRPERASLPWLRKPGFEGLAEALASDERAPDKGPALPHESAGACVVGARELLLAFNVDLESTDLRVAKRIAKALRTSSGGLPGVQAKGLRLERQGRVQVSMNLFDLAQTGPGHVFAEVERRAREAGAAVARSELVGMLPSEALREAGQALLHLETPLEGRVLQEQLLRIGDPAGSLTATLEAISGTASTDPGGGSAAALSLALSAACLRKALGFCDDKRGSLDAAARLTLSAEIPPYEAFFSLARRDHRAFAELLAAWQLPREQLDRKAVVRAARRAAVEVPSVAFRHAQVLAEAAARVAKEGNPNLVNDAAAAAEFALAAARVARLNARANQRKAQRAEDTLDLAPIEAAAQAAREAAEVS